MIKSRPHRSKLKRLVPNQQVAPLKFAVHDDKVVIVDQVPSAAPADEPNIAQAREALLKRGANILDELTRSNCDRRLLDSVMEMQNCLASSKNIIELGLLSTGCELMRSACAEELPAAVGAMLQAQTAQMSMYVAQFPDWSRFATQAEAVDMTAVDISRIHNATAQLVVTLRSDKDLDVSGNR